MSSARLFGTDGMRGGFGTYPLDEATVRRLGAVLSRRLEPSARVVLGGDTRDSTPALYAWLASGLREDLRITWLGTVPTPVVAHAARRLEAACGVAISASHNPYPDNGIKLLRGDGFKWPVAWEAELEEELLAPSRSPPPERPVEVEVDRDSVRAYLESLAAAPFWGDDAGSPLRGLAVAVDTGNGAASPYAEEVFARLGARITVINKEPDGRNINAGCGSTHPEVLAELMRETGCDLGFSFDGDADRVILADETSKVHDGDAILFLLGRELAELGELPGRRLVATSMSNLGLEEALGRHGIGLVRCDVGDRTVVETMQREGVILGGEQSGHIVHFGLGTTGDGLLTALSLANLRVRSKRPLSEMLRGFERFPQLIRNVGVSEKTPFEQLGAVVKTRQKLERELGESGRLVLRYSGTEPLARIMIEGRDRQRIEALAEELASVIAEEVGDDTDLRAR